MPDVFHWISECLKKNKVCVEDEKSCGSNIFVLKIIRCAEIKNVLIKEDIEICSKRDKDK